MGSLGHSSVPPTALGRQDDEEATPTGQGWRSSGTPHNILGTPAIKSFRILFQNNEVHYEVLGTNASDRSQNGWENMPKLRRGLVVNDAKFVYA
ncbi:hypothetical protein TNCV_45881 [Trichonephila clavipes]|nr:hypothetical protein TNCV_45881 [Trichonephila clavipes]